MVGMYSCVCVPKLWTQQQSARRDVYRYQAWMPMQQNRNQHLTMVRSMTRQEAVIYRMYGAMLRELQNIRDVLFPHNKYEAMRYIDGNVFLLQENRNLCRSCAEETVIEVHLLILHMSCQ